MKRSWAAGLLVFLILIVAGFYFTRATHSPPGQPALVELKATSAQQLQTEFDSQSISPRVILLLSPTCPTCLRGASSVESVLERHPDMHVVVFAVWEPMLPTDFIKPGTRVLRILNDNRVRQFWDADHTVASKLSAIEKNRQIHPDCCKNHDVLWDLIAVFPPGSKWNDHVAPVLFNGTVVNTAPQLESTLTRAD